MDNPFKSGQIKNYLLLYASIVVIMILFFIAASLFHDVEDIEKKVFNTDIENKVISENEVVESKTRPFKLMEKAY